MVDGNGDSKSQTKGQEGKEQPVPVSGNSRFYQISENKIVRQSMEQIDKKRIPADKMNRLFQMSGNNRSISGYQKVNGHTHKNHGRRIVKEGRILSGKEDFFNRRKEQSGCAQP